MKAICVILCVLVLVESEQNDHGLACLQSHNSGCRKDFTVKIHYWYGRLGNNILQLKHALYIAQKSESLLITPDHVLFKRTVYDFRSTPSNYMDWQVYKSCSEVVIEHLFAFFAKTTNPCNAVLGNMSHEESRQLLQQNLLPYLGLTIVPAPKDRLVIHIRSGDVFDIHERQTHNTSYIQPPCSYYKMIIEDHNFTDILIISTKHDDENLNNPCIQDLLLYNAMISYQHSDLIEDVSTVLGTTHLAFGTGTFAYELAILSKNVEDVHMTVIFEAECLDLIATRVTCYYFPDYIPLSSWTASDEQRQLMTEYPREKIQIR